VQYTTDRISSGAYVEGETYLLIPHQTKDSRIIRLERLSDGATVAAVLSRSQHCFLPWNGGAATSLFLIGREGGHRFFGRASTTPGAPIAWHASWVDDLPLMAQQRFIFDDAYGVVTYGGVLLYGAPTQPVAAHVEGGSGVIYGDGPQLVWGYGPAPIRSLTMDGGAVDLVPPVGTRHVLGMGLSPDRLAWIDAERPGDLFSEATWHWSPRTTDPAEVVVHDGPSLPVRGLVQNVRVFGDWVAADGLFGTSDPYLVRLFVWNIATGQAFTLPQRPGHLARELFAVTPTEVIFGDASAQGNTDHSTDHLVRLQLSALPAIVQAWSN
jgi:hypothetical protein